jgi:hypothetical protein
LAQQNQGIDRASVRSRLFDHLVGGNEQRLRHGQTERLGGLQVDYQFKFGRLLNRQIAGLGAP